MHAPALQTCLPDGSFCGQCLSGVTRARRWGKACALSVPGTVRIGDQDRLTNYWVALTAPSSGAYTAGFASFRNVSPLMSHATPNETTAIDSSQKIGLIESSTFATGDTHLSAPITSIEATIVYPHTL